MKKTEEFDGVTVHGLIADDEFIRWVNNPNEKLDRQWKLVRDRDAANARIVAEARALVKAINIQVDQPPGNVKERVFGRITSEISKDEYEEQPVVQRLWRRPLFRVAAAILLVGLVGLWFYLGQENASFPARNAPLSVNNGVIYLNDGRTLPFSDLEEGVASTFGGAVITIEPGNRLVYQATDRPTGTADVSGLTTPAGAVWEIELPDGSKASLNVQSTLRFASDNFGEQRRMSLDGEAYFEVAHDASKPFVVEAGEIEVTVLGTDFVVSGYEPSKSVNVALVDGSVQVKHELGNAVVIAPGQQALYNGGEIKPLVSTADLQQVLAWKNGLFSFESEPINDVMQVLGRWYDVTVAYEGTMPEKGITGTIPNDSSLENVLAILMDTGIDARLSLRGDTLVVSGEKSL